MGDKENGATESNQSIELFEPLQRQDTMANQVAERIEALIIENRIPAGEKFPPERELARQFNVSRTVIREAVRVLMAKGLLEVRMGSGTIVRSPTAESVAHTIRLFLRGQQMQIDYDKVHEVRRILEVEIADLAAERCTDGDVAEMSRILQEAAENQSRREKFAKLDVEFHNALARSTHNELFVLLLDSVAEIMYEIRYMAFEDPDMTSHALDYHQAIFKCVVAKDVAGARKAMQEHLMESEETMRRVAYIRK